MTREMTTDEVREQFLLHVCNMVRYWRDVDGGVEPKTVEERLSGLAFSILSAIDGSAMALPGFILAPSPHDEDRQFAIDEKLDTYYPQSPEVSTDIAGSLHELFHRVYDGTIKVTQRKPF